MPDAAGTDCQSPAALRHWLLSRVVTEHQSQRGAVIGSFDPDGRARYAYPEIAGYYLSWLASLEESDAAPKMLRTRASAITQWLSHWLANGHPTRCAMRPEPDWRNDGLFAFDLAMLLRGLTAAKSAALLPPEAEVLSAEVCALLCRLLDNRGELSPVLQLRSNLPQRWSTQVGAYQAKVGAALLLAGRNLTLPSVLVVSAHQLLRRCAEEANEPIHLESPHAALYSLEGLSIGLALGVIGSQTHNDLKRRLSDLREPLLEGISAGPKAGAFVRHDVVAQWLRLARLHRPEDPLIEDMERFLCCAIAPGGAMPFAQAPHDQGACTWAAIFCDQALSAPELTAERLI